MCNSVFFTKSTGLQTAISSSAKQLEKHHLSCLSGLDTGKSRVLIYDQCCHLYCVLAASQCTFLYCRLCIVCKQYQLLSSCSANRIANIGGLSVAEAARKLLNSLEQHSDLAAEVLEQATQNLQTDYPRHRNSNTTNNTSITTTAAAATIAAEKAASKQGPAAVPPSRMSIHQLVMDDRMLQLFRLWDKAGIGAVCFQELCLGIARFRPIHDKEVRLTAIRGAPSCL